MDEAFMMFAIGGNVSVPKYRSAKYELLEPLEAFIESSNEVSNNLPFSFCRSIFRNLVKI